VSESDVAVEDDDLETHIPSKHLPKQSFHSLTEGYDPADILYCVEFGLLWSCLPTDELMSKANDAQHGQLEHERLTVLLLFSITGEKFHPTVILSPRYADVS
jgi:hypothetical protein